MAKEVLIKMLIRIGREVLLKSLLPNLVDQNQCRKILEARLVRVIIMLSAVRSTSEVTTMIEK